MFVRGRCFFYPTDESSSHIHGNQFNLCFGTMQPFEKSSERLAVFASIDMEDSTGIQITNDCPVCRFARVVMTDGNFINADVSHFFEFDMFEFLCSFLPNTWSIFTSRKILREKLELHSTSKKSLNIAKMVEKRFELPVSTHDLAYEKIRLADCLKSLFFLTRAKILTCA